MSAVVFDSYEFHKTLREAGFDEKQAEALTRAQTKSIEQMHKDADYVSRTELKTDINELRKDMQTLEAGLKKDMAEMKADIFRAMMLQTFAIAGLVVAVVKWIN
ncbi:MAG: hypothetical protein IE928_03560 [Gammaproteobacteria bacterium]|nr:hypothetical protein [Gammaproteobacteria bacterium]